MNVSVSASPSPRGSAAPIGTPGIGSRSARRDRKVGGGVLHLAYQPNLGHAISHLKNNVSVLVSVIAR